MLSLLCITASCLQQPPPAIAREVPDYLAYPSGYKPKPGSIYQNISIPGPIDPAEWAVYGNFMRLSDAQRSALASSYDAYRRADWTFRTEHTQELWDRSAEINTYALNTVTRESATQRVALYKARDQILPELLQIENALFTQASTLLSDSQLSTLETVRLLRERRRARAFDSPFPGFAYDLDMVLMGYHEAGLDMKPHDSDAYEQLLNAWRSAATTLYTRHADERRKSQMDTLLVRADKYAAQAANQLDIAAELDEAYKRLRKPLGESARRIHDVHRVYIRLIADQLPPSTAHRLVSDFEGLVYGPLAPNPCDQTSIFTRAEESGLSESQKAQLAIVRADWHALDQAAETRVLSEYLSWNERVYAERSVDRNEYRNYADRMSGAMDSRIAGCNAALDALEAVLTEKQRKSIAKEIKKWRDGIAAFRAGQEQTRQKHGGWPGPSD